MQKEVSAVMFSYASTSHYHDTCVPTDKKRVELPASTKQLQQKDYELCDQVTRDTVWKQSVDKEWNGVKAWNANWGFLTQYDSKGNPKPPSPAPETSASVFSEVVPNTNAGEYGSRVHTENGRRMQQLEFQLQSHNRKKKLGKEMICY